MGTTTIDNTIAAPAVLADLTHLVGTDPACADRDDLRDLVARERRLRSFLDAYAVRVARRSRQIAQAERPSGDPVKPSTVIAGLLDAGCNSGRDAKANATREGLCSDLPEFEDALTKGAVSGGHIDALGHATRNLTDDERAELRDRAAELVDRASNEHVETFEKTARTIVDEIRSRHRRDAAVDELETQRKNSKVTEWVDRATGMHKTLLELDPVRAASLNLAVANNLAWLRRQPGNAKRPFDQLKVEAFLLAVTNPADGPPVARVPEVIVLIDWNTLRDGVQAAGGVCELSDGTPLPVATVRQMACDAEIIPAVLGGRGEVLDVGRARRLATHAQRVALRAMYSTCAEPGCTVAFDACHVHHTLEWNAHHGETNLADLLPICPAGHARLHELGWSIRIVGNHDRVVWARPDGSIAHDLPGRNRRPTPGPANPDDDAPG